MSKVNYVWVDNVHMNVYYSSTMSGYWESWCTTTSLTLWRTNQFELRRYNMEELRLYNGEASCSVWGKESIMFSVNVVSFCSIVCTCEILSRNFVSLYRFTDLASIAKTKIVLPANIQTRNTYIHKYMFLQHSMTSLKIIAIPFRNTAQIKKA